MPSGPGLVFLIDLIEFGTSLTIIGLFKLSSVVVVGGSGGRCLSIG